jgi:hypothetical protein
MTPGIGLHIHHGFAGVGDSCAGWRNLILHLGLIDIREKIGYKTEVSSGTKSTALCFVSSRYAIKKRTPDLIIN